MEDKGNKRIDCLKCEYFAVAWEPQFPRACKLYGFKSAGLPSVTVFRNTGIPCLGYVEKKHNTYVVSD